MSSSKPSNLERAKWRSTCRQLLSQHLQERLGLSIQPSNVRLHSTREDGYVWHFIPEVQHLFAKNLSEHSLRAYKELCEGVGKTFEAAVATSTEPLTGQHVFSSSTEPERLSFASHIGELQAQNDFLSQQVELLKLQLAQEAQSRISVTEKLTEVQEKSRGMLQRLEASNRREQRSRTLIITYAQGLAQIAKILNAMQSCPGVVEEGSN
ncbi:uncharacterized protein B0I36DRAFT_267715 [Microdochium trichocladiopsis]|uniref:Uncharacterized protein n=1 Tax=Microdochium trichocladiopsis TaxID=1682393 RepID=A0A9P8Y940_9PEZI|nr:uncharacterized protein B0I36DRAFT_267715 [Microdochium trichocladiopsis]KAH7031049.1 hypothetical protein B0I36DRAFT_267715 [Microdochium trichocladiopsis]